jgi:hypothetical protein
MHFSKRFAYDKHGRLKMAWFDSMYLGRFYMVAGPDTTLYRYDSQNRLVEEEQHYTTSMHNKREIDTTGLSLFEKESVQWYKDQFYTGSPFQPKAVSYIKYHYEKFDPVKRQTLAIPQLN